MSRNVPICMAARALVWTLAAAQLLARARLQPRMNSGGSGESCWASGSASSACDAVVGSTAAACLLMGEAGPRARSRTRGRAARARAAGRRAGARRHAEADPQVLRVGLRSRRCGRDLEVGARRRARAPDVAPEPPDELLAQAVGPDLVDEELQPAFARAGRGSRRSRGKTPGSRDDLGASSGATRRRSSARSAAALESRRRRGC